MEGNCTKLLSLFCMLSVSLSLKNGMRITCAAKPPLKDLFFFRLEYWHCGHILSWLKRFYCFDLKLQMMLYGGIFGCLSPILSISAFLSYKSPFIYPKDEVSFQNVPSICNFFHFFNIKGIYVMDFTQFSLYACWGQRQNVERAKLALLADKLDGSFDSYDGHRQSDHLLMMIAYKKWEKIVREVSQCLVDLMIYKLFLYVCVGLFTFSTRQGTLCLVVSVTLPLVKSSHSMNLYNFNKSMFWYKNATYFLFSIMMNYLAFIGSMVLTVSITSSLWLSILDCIYIHPSDQITCSWCLSKWDVANTINLVSAERN